MKEKRELFFLQFVNYCSLARQLYFNCVERKEQLEGLHRQRNDDDLSVGIEENKTQKNFAHCFLRFSQFEITYIVVLHNVDDPEER